jgi:hypothetical protein
MPSALVNYKTQELSTITVNMLLDTATEFRDKCEFIVLFNQMLRMLLQSALIVRLLDIDSNRAVSGILNSSFNRKHRNFLNQLWSTIFSSGMWPLLKFIMSVGLSVALSKRKSTSTDSENQPK